MKGRDAATENYQRFLVFASSSSLNSTLSGEILQRHILLERRELFHVVEQTDIEIGALQVVRSKS